MKALFLQVTLLSVLVLSSCSSQRIATSTEGTVSNTTANGATATESTNPSPAEGVISNMKSTSTTTNTPGKVKEFRVDR